MHRRTFFGCLFGSVAASCGVTAPAKAAGPRLDGIYVFVAPPLSPDEKARLLADWEATYHGVGRAHKAIALPDDIARIPAWEGPPPPEARP